MTILLSSILGGTFEGFQGVQGAQGAQGFQGVQGAQGRQGAQGFQGVQGAQGFQGVQGAQGFQGVQGAQGAQGFQGVQGAQGAQGHQGFQGVQGAQGFQGVQGAQGRQGAQGHQGVQGAQGFQGVQGAQGAQGFQGVQGAQGFQGVQGAQGFQGVQGAQGFQGVQGAQGFQGVQGAQGAQGFQGVQGAQGHQGVQGAQGFQGVQGAQGHQGFQGVQGAQGFQGVQGATLTIGTSAADVLSTDTGQIIADDATVDKIVFWDDSASKLTYLAVGSNLTITDTTIAATGGGGESYWIQTSAGIHTLSNVGIGTTNPTTKLDVRGDVSIASTLGIGTVIDIVPYDTLNSGTLSWEGSAGQLFSITNNLTTGSIYSVNDVSGIPSIDVDADGTIELGPYGGNIGLGTTNPTAKLHVVGTSLITGISTIGNLGITPVGTGATVGGVGVVTYYGDGGSLINIPSPVMMGMIF